MVLIQLEGQVKYSQNGKKVLKVLHLYIPKQNEYWKWIWSKGFFPTHLLNSVSIVGTETVTVRIIPQTAKSSEAVIALEPTNEINTWVVTRVLIQLECQVKY